MAESRGFLHACGLGIVQDAQRSDRESPTLALLPSLNEYVGEHALYFLALALRAARTRVVVTGHRLDALEVMPAVAAGVLVGGHL